MAGTLEFCFDFISPYSYVAANAVPVVLEGTDVTVDYRPVFLGAIMKGSDNRPPGLVPAKGAYMQKDLLRSCARYGLGFRMHPGFPMMNTRPCLRIACALSAEPDVQAAFVRTIFHQVWASETPLNTDDMEQVRAVCDAAGLDGARLAGLAEDEAAKTALTDNTNAALARGAFGAPSFFVADELYFGHDRLDYALEALQRQA